jgi:hypothetical protein
MSIGDLLDGSELPPATRQAVVALIRDKRDTPELGDRPPIAEIDAWSVGELERLDPSRLPWTDPPARDVKGEADRLYRRVIGIGAS